MKILDYYYLVLLRCMGTIRFDHKPPGIMALFFTFNFFSLAIPFMRNSGNFLMNLGICLFFVLLSSITLQIVYNTKRRDKILSEYKRESRKSRERGAIKVVAYLLLSVVFLILAVVVTKHYSLSDA